jgi:hypothetical protein
LFATPRAAELRPWMGERGSREDEPVSADQPITLHPVMERDGQILITGLPWNRGQRLAITIQAEEGDDMEHQPLSARELLESGLVGMWADRTDIGDSSEFARKLRQAAEHRS